MKSAPFYAALLAAQQHLAVDPSEAERRAKAILKAAPKMPAATLILAQARRRRGDADGARALLAPLAREWPRDALIQYELGESLVALGRGDSAIAALRKAVTARPDFGLAWRVLADQLFAAGDRAGADEAYGCYFSAPIDEPALIQASQALSGGRLEEAEGKLSAILHDRPHEVRALAMLGEAYLKQRRYLEALGPLSRCLQRRPGHTGVVHGLCHALIGLGLYDEAIAPLEDLVRKTPDSVDLRALLGTCASSLGDQDRAITLFQHTLADAPRKAHVWMLLGTSLKAVGRTDEAVAAFRRAIEVGPDHAEAWFMLGELKTLRYTADDRAALRRLAEDLAVKGRDRVFIHFALARALEDDGAYEDAFAQYAAGAGLNRSLHPYDSEEFAARRRADEALFSAEFFASRAEGGDPSPAPIFIVGLPRSGSTLVEQILSSHSAVEGTMELPYLPRIASEFFGGKIAALSSAERTAQGEIYLAKAARHRRRDRPFFIDKAPANFQNIGLIQLVLPNAKIIDVRRHPLGSGVSLFRQLFRSPGGFSCDLADIGRHYRDYLGLMRHFDRVLPGRIHQVIYEDLVADPEAEIRHLLAYCGLPFEEACLRFHETRRPVMTPSSEQVRRPITKEGLEYWRRYEPWLAPLKVALGQALEAWRE